MNSNSIFCCGLKNPDSFTFTFFMELKYIFYSIQLLPNKLHKTFPLCGINVLCDEHPLTCKLLLMKRNPAVYLNNSTSVGAVFSCRSDNFPISLSMFSASKAIRIPHTKICWYILIINALSKKIGISSCHSAVQLPLSLSMKDYGIMSLKTDSQISFRNIIPNIISSA